MTYNKYKIPSVWSVNTAGWRLTYGTIWISRYETSYTNFCTSCISSRHLLYLQNITLYLCNNTIKCTWVSEWLLFNANSAIFQLYYGKNKLIFRDDDEVRLVLDQHAELDFNSARSLKQQSVGRHVAPLGHIILSQPAFALFP